MTLSEAKQQLYESEIELQKRRASLNIAINAEEFAKRAWKLSLRKYEAALDDQDKSITAQEENS